jgi:hypothetical protein
MTIHHKLAHLSSDEISSLMQQYYDGERTADLIAAFKLDIKSGELIRLFPPVIHEDLFCPYCADVHLMSKRPSRSGGPPTPNCPECGHLHIGNCWCGNCRELEARRRIEVEIRKREVIEAEFRHPASAPDIGNLTLRDALYLMSAMRHSVSEDLKFIEPFAGDLPLAPTFEFQDEISRHLYSKGLIRISPESNCEAFSFDPAITHVISYHPAKILWEFLPALNVEEKRSCLLDIQRRIKDRWPESWNNEKAAIWRQIAKYECLEHFCTC